MKLLNIKSSLNILHLFFCGLWMFFFILNFQKSTQTLVQTESFLIRFIYTEKDAHFVMIFTWELKDQNQITYETMLTHEKIHLRQFLFLLFSEILDILGFFLSFYVFCVVFVFFMKAFQQFLQIPILFS